LLRENSVTFFWIFEFHTVVQQHTAGDVEFFVM